MAIDIANLRGLDEAAQNLARLNAGLGRAITKPLLDSVGQQAAALQKSLAAPAAIAAMKAQESIAKSVMQAARPALNDALGLKVSTVFAKMTESPLAKISETFAARTLPSMQISNKLMEGIKQAYPLVEPDRYKIDMSPMIRAEAEKRSAIVNTPALLEEILDVAIAEREDARVDRKAAAADREAAAGERCTTRRRSRLALAIAAAGVAIAYVPHADNIWSAIQTFGDWVYRPFAG